MTDSPDDAAGNGLLFDFNSYLRTGRRRLQLAAEVKFNPWHDPDDGRFTFAGRGTYFGRGSAGEATRVPNFAKPPMISVSRHRSLSATDGTGVSETDVEIAHRRRAQLDDPKNVSIYVVKKGDSLSRIANLRKGLRVADLAELNGISIDGILPVGKKLRLPTQAFLERGKAAWENFLNLQFYMRTHGGELPPDVAHVPTIQTQIDTELETVSRNGYTYKIDFLLRFRGVNGEPRLGPVAARSRRAQREAGGKDRRATDDGGHYIAARFNGPSDWFNHFAQDANFNRGTYKTLENGWAKELRAGHKVFVDIAPHYSGLSTRPDSLTVTWFVDGKRYSRGLPNERTRKKNDR